MLRFSSVFIATIFLALHYGTILYVNSSLLGQYFTPNVVSLLFLIGALGNIILFLNAPKLIRRFGKRRLLLFALIFSTLNTFFLSLASTWQVVAISFVLYASILPLVFYCLDIFLEELTEDTNTGEIRGIYLTVLSLGIALGPLVLALLAEDGSLQSVYLVSALLLVPIIFVAHFFFRSQVPKSHAPYHYSPRLPFGAWWQDSNIRRVTLSRLILEFFFAFMVIYTPVYLHSELGFEWSEIGVMFTVMLIPFVLFEWPAGELADHFWGEKEMLSVGFVITGVSLLVMPFLGKTFFLWMIVLLISRIGAALIEIMTESYFFKHISADETGLISIFRLSRAVSVVLGALVGAVALSLFSFDKIFLVLAVVVFFGLKESSHLQDTR
jgi:MFS family permease